MARNSVEAEMLVVPEVVGAKMGDGCADAGGRGGGGGGRNAVEEVGLGPGVGEEEFGGFGGRGRGDGLGRVGGWSCSVDV